MQLLSAHAYPGLTVALSSFQEVLSQYTPTMKLLLEQSQESYTQFHQITASFKNSLFESYGVTDSISVQEDIKSQMSNDLQYVAIEMKKISPVDPELTLPVEPLPQEEVEAVNQELEDVFQDKQNWQQKLVALTTKWCVKNPVIAFLLTAIILQIMIGLITDEIGRVLRPTTVKAAPLKNAAVVCQVDENTAVTITGTVPYYFEVEIDNGQNTKIRGYVSKRSVQLLSDEE